MPRKNVDTTKPIAYKQFLDTKLILPKDPFLYKLRRMAWLINNIHRKLQHDPTCIPYKQYREALDDYAKLIEEAKKKGLDTAEGRRNARQGVDAQDVDESVSETQEDSMGEEAPFSMGS